MYSDGLAVGTELAEAAAGAACGWGSSEFVHFRRCPYLSRHYGLMTRGDRGRGRGDRSRGSGGRWGRPRKRTGIPLDLGDTEAETSTPSPVTQTPVIPTPSLSEGLPAMRMIPTPGSRVQSSETTETRSQHAIPTQTTTGSEDPPPPEPDPSPRRRSSLDRRVASTFAMTAVEIYVAWIAYWYPRQIWVIGVAPVGAHPWLFGEMFPQTAAIFDYNVRTELQIYKESSLDLHQSFIVDQIEEWWKDHLKRNSNTQVSKVFCV
ncbi:hypothetical protein PIB30_017829 [Stylosanthes scabra]|uniref:Uncharacterized protein n=1 Tax=Stylosanthes scabra TaxID=79078 RepID=A0ABU6W7M9_9FABA|nr:hypothetical protein [Stylosanthes scabra]